MLFTLLLVANSSFAQWSNIDIQPHKQQAQKEVDEYTEQQLSSGKWDRDEPSLEMMFTTDTMLIERTAYLISESKGYSTMAMMLTTQYQKDEYDKLLNKYYGKVMAKLSATDKVKIRDAQRAWLKYRDGEENICQIIGYGTYTGGGSMYPLIASGRMLAIIQERVCSLYEFLSYIQG